MSREFREFSADVSSEKADEAPGFLIRSTRANRGLDSDFYAVAVIT